MTGPTVGIGEAGAVFWLKGWREKARNSSKHGPNRPSLLWEGL